MSFFAEESRVEEDGGESHCMTCHLGYTTYSVPVPTSPVSSPWYPHTLAVLIHVPMSIVDWESLVREHHVIATLFRTKGQSFARCLMFNAGLTFVDRQNNLLYPSVHVHRGIHVELSMNLTSYRWTIGGWFHCCLSNRKRNSQVC